MTDGVIKGTGNSRYLKSPSNVLSLYPTWEAAAAALANGTFPVDFNGINSAGWTTVGTKLNKASLLTDALCTNLGIATTSTPTQAMDKLRTLVSTAQTAADGRALVAAGSYVGTGGVGSLSARSLTFSFAPKIVLIPGYAGSGEGFRFYYKDGIYIWLILTSTLSTSYKLGVGFGISDSNGAAYGKKSADGRTISWYHPRDDLPAEYQFNTLNATYHYLAIG